MRPEFVKLRALVRHKGKERIEQREFMPIVVEDDFFHLEGPYYVPTEQIEGEPDENIRVFQMQTSHLGQPVPARVNTTGRYKTVRRNKLLPIGMRFTTENIYATVKAAEGNVPSEIKTRIEQVDQEVKKLQAEREELDHKEHTLIKEATLKVLQAPTDEPAK